MKCNKRSVSRIFLAFLLLVGAAGIAGAQDLSFSLGGWSFFPDAEGRLPAGDPGLFASAGATCGLGLRLELGASLIPRLTPTPLRDLFAEAHLGLSLLADRARLPAAPTMYLNSIVDLGTIVGWRDLDSGSPAFSKAIFARLTPVAIGSLYYGRRDRLFSLGVMYDFDEGTANIFASLIAADFSLAPPPKVR
ncbi:hypothetical protein LWX53_05760 [bacterium]|nr:hypothetical protein [bacterium]